MPENEKPLRHHHSGWWKVDDELIWYLAGFDPEYKPGWYFVNEADMFDGPYSCRTNAQSAMKEYWEHM